MAGLVSFARAYFVDNPAVQNIQLGMGYNSLLGQTTQPAVIDRAPVQPPGGPQAVQYTLHICSSTEELNQALSVSASASYGSNLFGSVSGRADFARSLSQHRYYLYLAVRCTVINASTYLTDPAASPEFAKLTGDRTIDWKRFYDKFGDSYVSSFQTGGEFIGILRWQTTTRSEQTKVAAEVKGQFTSGSFDAQSSAQLSSLKTSSDYQVFVYRNGSHGGVPAARDMVDTARQFPSTVESQDGNATIYGFAVQDYASLVPANLPSVANRLARLQEYAGWATRAAVSASDVT